MPSNTHPTNMNHKTGIVSNQGADHLDYRVGGAKAPDRMLCSLLIDNLHASLIRLHFDTDAGT
eukprot:scaffold114473_cov14-Tisochrysis_lutea.AAC.2